MPTPRLANAESSPTAYCPIPPLDRRHRRISGWGPRPCVISVAQHPVRDARWLGTRDGRVQPRLWRIFVLARTSHGSSTRAPSPSGRGKSRLVCALRRRDRCAGRSGLTLWPRTFGPRRHLRWRPRSARVEVSGPAPDGSLTAPHRTLRRLRLREPVRAAQRRLLRNSS